MQSSPEQLARGLAVGIFWGSFPFFGTQMVVSIALATLVRGNKFMAALGTWVSNPVTDGPIFFFNFQVGRWLLQDWRINDPNFQFEQNLMQRSSEFFATLLTGCLIVGSVSSVLAYVGGKWFFRRMQAQRRRKLAGLETQAISSWEDT